MEYERKEPISTVIRSRLDRLDDAVCTSRIGSYFQLDARNTTFTTEIRAGLICFFTVCYIVAVNPAILANTAGTCTPEACTGSTHGEPNCRFEDPPNPGWQACIAATRSSLVAATSIAAMIACFVMGAVANMPLPLAPGMGINAYFTYNVVGFYGSGPLSYQAALAAVFVEGWIFIAISASGARQKIATIVPRYIVYATSCGIGMFLCFIGLQSAGGIGIIAADGATLVTLGGCPAASRTYAYYMAPEQATFSSLCSSDNETVSLPPPSATYACKTDVVRSATLWLGVAGGAVMLILACRDIPAAILYGVLFVTFISWIPGHAASYLGAGSQVPGGEARLQYFQQGVTAPNVAKTAGQFEFSALADANTWTYLVTFLYLDFLDATSTMFAMANLMSLNVPGFVDDKGRWPKHLATMCLDGFAIVLGACLGLSPLTVLAESAVAVREGGRTGITTIVIALGFGITMFMAPIFSNIPGYATGPALILVGAHMVGEARHIEWTSVRVAFPAFITMVMMPLTYSIAYGVLAGLGCTLFLWLTMSLWDLVEVMLGRSRKTYRIVWLEAFCNVYLAFNLEGVLIEELPGCDGRQVSQALVKAAASLGNDPATVVMSLRRALTAAELAAAGHQRDSSRGAEGADDERDTVGEMDEMSPIAATFDRGSNWVFNRRSNFR